LTRRVCLDREAVDPVPRRRLGPPVALAGAALATDVPAVHPPASAISLPDLHLSLSELPGETSLRLPLASENYVLYGLLSPYLSLGSNSALAVPGGSPLAPGLRRDTDGLDGLRLGAGFTVPLSERAQLYGEYRFLHGRLDTEAGRGLLQREPDSADFRAGFSMRLN